MAAKVNARLKEKYQKEIRPALQKELGLNNLMAVPRLEKIVLNMGLGEATQNVKIMDPLVADLASVAGQKPVTTGPRSRSPPSRCARACPSAPWSPCAATSCTNFSTA